MKIDLYVEMIQQTRELGPVCLVLSTSDFRDETASIENLKHTNRDVQQSDKVIVIDHRTVPTTSVVIKCRNSDITDYQMICRPSILYLD